MRPTKAELHAALTAPDLARKPYVSVARLQRIYGFVFLLCMVALLTAVGWWSYAGALREARSMAQSLTHLAANQVGRMTESADLLLIDLWRIARVTDWGDPSVVALAQKDVDILARQLPHIARLMIYGPDGKLRIASSDHGSVPDSVDLETFFAVHRPAGGDLYISPVQTLQPDGPAIILSRRVAGRNDMFDGIVAVTIRPAAFSSFYRSLNVRDSSVFHLVHAELKLLAREPAAAAEPNSSDRIPARLRQAVAQDESGPFVYRTSDGALWIAGLRQVEDYPLYASVAVSRAAVTQRWLRETLPYFGFSVLALLGLGLLTGVAIQRARRADEFRAALLHSHELLEARVQERTRSLEEALEQKDVLFKELNHRVKNNLQIVSSLLQLQAGKFADPAVTRAFQSCLGRIRSMSAVHELLYRKDHLAHVDFGDYLGMLCAGLAESYGEGGRIRLEVDADPDLLDVQTAVPLALFVNEVVSNSFKHAFPDGRSGRILVSYRRRPGGRQLVIRDDGVGLRPGAGSGTSLGLKLSQALAQQIGGTLRQEPADPGTRTELTFHRGAAADDADRSGAAGGTMGTASAP